MLRVWRIKSRTLRFIASRLPVVVGRFNLGYLRIGSEMVDPPEKLSNDHAHDTQSFCLPNAIVELSEHRSERRAIGKLPESLAGQLIERLAQGSAMESVISSAAAVLQSADEMKMAELNDPALAYAEFDNTKYTTQSLPRKRKYSPSKTKTKGPLGKCKSRDRDVNCRRVPPQTADSNPWWVRP